MSLDFPTAFTRCPLVAILRGVQPDEVEPIGDALVEAGFTLIEVPMNSPDPIDSIARLARRFEGRALVGAGTVLTVEQVEQVRQAGGQLVISPNSDIAVIAATAQAGMISMPGYFTPTEAFAAIAAVSRSGRIRYSSSTSIRRTPARPMPSVMAASASKETSGGPA